MRKGGYALRALPYLFLIAVVAMLQLGDVVFALDNFLREQRFRLTGHDATGQVLVVEIDAKSLNELEVWPFPRRHHGAVLKALEQAGASEVAFDVDFSALSNAEDDQAFEDALKAAKPTVILPKFQQSLSAGGGGEFTLNRPLKRFADHAWIGSVNVDPDPDGILRMYHSGAGPGHQLTLVDLLSGRSIFDLDQFLLDFSVRPKTIPRLSYIDVLKGRFDPAEVAGRKVIIGGTAVELGDNFSVPALGVIPGPLLQAVALENMLQGRMLHRQSDTLTLMLLALLLLPLAWWFTHVDWRLAIPATIAASIVIEVGAIAVQKFFPLAPATAAVHLALALYLIIVLAREIDFQAILARVARTEKENGEEIMQQVFAHSFDGVVIAGEDGKTLVFNDAARAILKRRNDNLRKDNLRNDTPRGDGLAGGVRKGDLPPEMADAMAQALGAGGEHDGSMREFTHMPPGGEAVHIEFAVSRAQLRRTDESDGTSAGTMTVGICTFRDITERKRAEHAIRRAADAAVSANRAKTQFMNNMSHELRTPLNAVIGFSELIKNESFGPLGAPRYGEFASEIHRGGEKLLETINGIIDITQLEAGTTEFIEDDIELAEVFALAERGARDWPETAGRTLEFDLGGLMPVLRADFRMLRQLLLHLVSNSVKFTDKDGAISVSARTGNDGGLRLEVRDDGIGIPDHALGEVTKPFVQADGGRDRHREGVGLGLALVKAFTRAFDGMMEIQSTPGEGTRVIIHVPSERVLSFNKAEPKKRPAVARMTLPPAPAPRVEPRMEGADAAPLQTAPAAPPAFDGRRPSVAEHDPTPPATDPAVSWPRSA